MAGITSLSALILFDLWNRQIRGSYRSIIVQNCVPMIESFLSANEIFSSNFLIGIDRDFGQSILNFHYFFRKIFQATFLTSWNHLPWLFQPHFPILLQPELLEDLSHHYFISFLSTYRGLYLCSDLPVHLSSISPNF